MKKFSAGLLVMFALAGAQTFPDEQLFGYVKGAEKTKAKIRVKVGFNF